MSNGFPSRDISTKETNDRGAIISFWWAASIGISMIDAAPPEGSDNTKLRKMRADRIGKLGALPVEHQPHPVKHHHALLLGGDLTGTKRIVGRVTASQIASASPASFFPRFT
jgi:hypothetical protein